MAHRYMAGEQPGQGDPSTGAVGITLEIVAKLVHPKDGHRKILAMIDAYLDQSGIHDGAAICVIAGYFGGRGRLGKLETAWKQVLKDFRFPMSEFHAKNLLGSRKHQAMLVALAE